jgi:hypothetical protein
MLKASQLVYADLSGFGGASGLVVQGEGVFRAAQTCIDVAANLIQLNRDLRARVAASR